MMQNRKKILILGAGEAQLNLIKCAKNLNYYTIVCDKRPEMEGSKLADKYYELNYMDKESISKIVEIENVDGVISNSEPAMPNVSFLVDKYNLPGNSQESLNKLISKTEFRKLQSDNNVFCPKSYTVKNQEELLNITKKIKFPIIIKPAECSGSRGATKIDSYDISKMIETYELCKDFSRNDLVVVEEFIQMVSLDVINADVFVYNENILWDGWYGGLRSKKRPMIPMTKVLPPNVPKTVLEKIKQDVNKILIASNVSLGEFNVETYLTSDNEIFIIEINPRQAGDNIPKLICEHTGVDLTKLLVSLTVNDLSYFEFLKKYKRKNKSILLQVVFSDKDGIYNGLYINPEIKPFVKWIEEHYEFGDIVKNARNAADAIAYVDLEFETLNQQRYFLNDIESFIYALVTKK